MDKKRREHLEKMAWNIRRAGLEMVREARSGHIGGAFSLSEIMAVLYFEKMNIDPQDPAKEDRDRLVLSKGHATVALYPALALRGFFPRERLKTFRKIDGKLSGHAEMTGVPGVDMSTGSLGQGLSAAVGMAQAAELTKNKCTVYAIVGDGEIQEGQIWEGLMYAGAHRLDHLIVIVDCNKVQLDGAVRDILDTGDLQAKFESFELHTQSIDGHSVEEVSAAIDAAKEARGKAHVIIANTIKGKGVSFMEGKNQWHGKTPDDSEFERAFAELEARS